MKLRDPYVWKSGLAALGVLSLVSFQSVGAQTATPAPSSGSTATATAPATGNGTTGGSGGDGSSGWGGRDDNGGMRWGGMNGGRGGMMPGGFDKDGRGPFGGGMHLGGLAGVDAQSVADFLGLTPEQVRADLDAGQSLSQIAVAQGKTRDELETFLVQKATAAIDAAIDATVTPKSGATSGDVPATSPSVASTPTT